MADVLFGQDDEPFKPAPVADFGAEDEVVRPDTSGPGLRAQAFGQGVVKGLVEQAPVAAGAITGAKIGMTLGAPLGPPGVLAGGVLGTLGGGAAGILFKDEAADFVAKVTIPGTKTTLTFDNINAVPEALRPWAVGGETFGGSVPYAALPFAGKAKGVSNLAGRMWDGIINHAQTAPLSFSLVELSSTLGASTAAGVAEELWPGQELYRIPSEIAGGFFNPTRWMTTAAKSSFSWLSRINLSLSAERQMDEAGKILQGVLEKFGEDPEVVIRQLRASDDLLPGINLTPGIKTNSPALLALEGKLSRLSSEYGAESAKVAKEALDELETTLGLMEHVGSPEALRAAARVRANYFDALLGSRLRAAEHQALEAAALINPADPVSRASFGRNVTSVLEGAIADVRGVETELWSKVDKAIEAPVEAVLDRVSTIRGRLLPTEKLPKILEDYLTFIDEAAKASEPVPVTVGQMLTLRSRMLALSREAAARNEWSDANIYGQVAEAALDDLEAVRATDPAIDAARAWSRELHQKFSQTFAGDVLDLRKSGEARIPPELVMKRAFAAGGEEAELQFRQLEEAVRMAGSQYATQMLQAQEGTLRYTAAQLIDPTTGRVNPDRLARFMRDERDLLNRFPELQAQLGSAEQAERFLRDTQGRVANSRKVIERETAFSQLLGTENPALVVERALNGDNPLKDFSALARFAARGGEQTRDALRTSVFDLIFDKARDQAGNFSFKRYQEALNGTTTPGGPSFADVLVQSGVVPRQEMDRLNAIVTRALQVEDAVTNKASLDEFMQETSPIIDVTLRLLGSRLGSHLPMGQANSLVVQGATSRFVRQVLDKMPNEKVRDLIFKAGRDPEFAAMLLQRQVSHAEQLKAARQMNAFLWQIGVGGWNEDGGVELPQ